MTPTEVEIKKAADEMVEMFADVEMPRSCDMATIGYDAAVQCAIAHCKRVIEVLDKFEDFVFPESYIVEQTINEHRLILSELEGRVK